jgi:hypothetical protein
MADRVGFAITVFAVWIGLTARVCAQSAAETAAQTAMQLFRPRKWEEAAAAFAGLEKTAPGLIRELSTSA